MWWTLSLWWATVADSHSPEGKAAWPDWRAHCWHSQHESLCKWIHVCNDPHYFSFPVRSCLLKFWANWLMKIWVSCMNLDFMYAVEPSLLLTSLRPHKVLWLMYIPKQNLNSTLSLLVRSWIWVFYFILPYNITSIKTIE